MNKKILIIGSICAVAILLGVSFTSVVGYSGNTSNYVNVSPLYNIRTNRAIENDEDVTTCNYVGKGRQSIISIPTIDRKIAMMINGIRGMNNHEFSEFVGLVIKYFKNDDKIENTDINKIVKGFYQLRENSEILNYADGIITIVDNIFLCGIIMLLSIPFSIMWFIFVVITFIATFYCPPSSDTDCTSFCLSCKSAACPCD